MADRYVFDPRLVWELPHIANARSMAEGLEIDRVCIDDEQTGEENQGGDQAGLNPGKDTHLVKVLRKVTGNQGRIGSPPAQKSTSR